MSKITKPTPKPIKKVTKVPQLSASQSSVLGQGVAKLPIDVPSDDENEQISEPEKVDEAHPRIASANSASDIVKLVEDVKQAQIKERVTPDNYTFRFGKYKQMQAKDIIKLQKENKLGQMEPVGLKYIMWLINEATWLNSFDQLKSLIRIRKILVGMERS